LQLMELTGIAGAIAAGLLIGLGIWPGVLIGRFVELSHAAIARVTGFGAGALIAVVAFELVAQASNEAGLGVVMPAFLAGCALFGLVNAWLARRGGKHRKRCGNCVQQTSESEQPGSGAAMVVGALFDGLPKAVVVGISAVEGITAVVIIGFFLAKLPQALSSGTGMHHAGRSNGYIVGLWGAVALLLVVIPPLAYAMLVGASPLWLAVTLSIAAGATLGVMVEVMLPEAVHGAPTFSGLIAGFGFVGLFALGIATGF
jgi:zinc transporter, ZIP family